VVTKVAGPAGGLAESGRVSIFAVAPLVLTVFQLNDVPPDCKISKQAQTPQFHELLGH